MNEGRFHDRLRELREKKGIAKTDVARAAGISSTAYYFYEIGKHRPSSIETYGLIAKALGCEISYLTFDDERFSQMGEQTTGDMTITGDGPADTEMTFGQKLKSLRERKGMSRNEVADLAGIAHSTYGKYECDSNLPLRGESYDKLARVLDCEVSYLKEGAEQAYKALYSPRKEFGRRIRSARENIGMELRELADRIGIPSSTIYKYEIGCNRPKDIGVYDMLAEVLHVDPRIFKELDPRCDVYSGSDGKTVDIGWETVSGVYADDNLTQHKPMTNEEAEVPRSGLETESDISPDLVKEDRQGERVDPETTTIDQDLRPADLFYEIIQLTSRLSALLAGKRLTRKEKDIIKTSLDMAYREGIE